MNTKYTKCPQCKRTKFRHIKGLCQSCYVVNFNRKNAPPPRNPKNINLTNLQIEFIIGCLLGDGWISNLKYGRKNPNLGIDRKLDDIKYLEWQFEFIKSLCLRPITIRKRFNKTTKKTKKHCIIETRYLPSLFQFRQKWYPKNKKIVPKNLKLTKLILQIWYCDDGSLETNNSSFRIKFATHGFSKKEVKFLADLLSNRYDGKFSVIKDRPDRNQWIIRANVDATCSFLNDIKEGFPPGMERKLPLKLLAQKTKQRKLKK